MVDALSSAVLSIHQALKNVAEVVDTAEEIEEERKKEMMLTFLSAFLILIPIGGEVLSAISGMATIGRIVAVAGRGPWSASTFTQLLKTRHRLHSSSLAIFCRWGRSEMLRNFKVPPGHVVR